MKTTNKDHRLRFVKAVFLLGAFMDFITAIEMFTSAIWGDASPFIGTGLTIPGGYGYRYAMFIGAVFMLGWAALLGWGYFSPLPRRGTLLITEFPIMPGLIVSQYLPLKWNLVVLRDILFPLIVQVSIFGLLITGFLIAQKLAKNQQNA